MLDDFGAFPAVIEAELRRYLPFLATTKVLMAAVRHGTGRETAHEAIKEHAVAVALGMRETGGGNDLVDRLAADDRLGHEPRGPRRRAGRPDRPDRHRPGPGRHARRRGSRDVAADPPARRRVRAGPVL